MRTLFIVLAALGGMLFAQPTLTSLGPTGGIITHLTGTPNDEAVLAVAKDDALYRSTDGGVSWSRLTIPNDPVRTSEIGDVAFHPQSPDMIFLAAANGLYRSSNGGVTWTVNTSVPYPTHSIVFAPSNPTLAYGSDDMGVLRSTDGGVTWTSLKDNRYFGNRLIRHLALHPADKSSPRIIATTGVQDTTGILYSPDGGVSWRSFTRGLTTPASRRIFTVRFDTTSMQGNNFRAVVGTADGLYGMQTDKLDSGWLQVRSTITPFSGTVTSGTVLFHGVDTASGEYHYSVFFTANASETGGVPRASTVQNGLFRIESRQGTIYEFFPITVPPVRRLFPGTLEIFAVHSPQQKNAGKFYLGTSGGIYVSQDTGATWQPMNTGIAATEIRTLVSLKTGAAGKLLFAGTLGGGVLRSLDDGSTWNAMNTGLTNPYVSTVIADPKRNMLYAGTQYTLYRSTNLGAAWQPLFTVDSSVLVHKERFITGMNDMTVRVSPLNPDLLMMHARAFGLRLSTNGGVTWNFIAPPFADETLHVPEHIAFDPFDSSTIYYAGYGMYRSKDLGRSWQEISTGIPKIIATASGTTVLSTLSPVVNPNNRQEMLVASVIDEQSGQPYRVYKTTNGGTVWDSLSVSAYNTVYDPFDDRRIIASGRSGVFGSEDGGTTWQQFSPTQSEPRYLLVSPHAEDPNMFYIGSDRGAYRLQFNGSAKLTTDVTSLDFGMVSAGMDSLRSITFSNTGGTRTVVVKFIALTDSVSFRYPGPRQFDVAAGATMNIPVRYIGGTGGLNTGMIIFATNDPVLSAVKVNLAGVTVTKSIIAKFSADLGTVTVGKDTVVDVLIDNSEGTKALTLTYHHAIGDSAQFQILGNGTVTADSAKTALLSIRFAPLTAGGKSSTLFFTSSDTRLPGFPFRVTGEGVNRNFRPRRILIDSSVGFSSYAGVSMTDYTRLLSLSLRRSDITVQSMKSVPFNGYNTLAYFLPDGAPPPDLADSLQRYVGNGGTLVIVGDRDTMRTAGLNSFLADAGWDNKFQQKTGIRFSTVTVSDSMNDARGWFGAVTGFPVSSHVYCSSVDSIIMTYPLSVTADTSLYHVQTLFRTHSTSLRSVGSTNTTSSTAVSSVDLVVLSKIGKGRIVLIADCDLWGNGSTVDTVRVSGVYAAKNLQFALNIFGLVDDVVAQLEPTPQEAYDMIAVPYAFSDSTVSTLFKDLGPWNKITWRMFGKYDARKGYAEFPTDFRSVSRGEGYWLIQKNPIAVGFGTTSVPGTAEDFPITLHPGYNMIGNPFPYRVSWALSLREDSVENVLWSYNHGDYDSVTTVMEPFRGYWVKNRATRPRTIRINGAMVSDKTTAVPKRSDAARSFFPDEWLIRLSATAKEGSDRENSAGVLRGASDEWDAFDISEPPMSPSGKISFSFRANDGTMAADLRETGKDGYCWNAELRAPAGSRITLQWERSGNTAGVERIYLLDNQLERMYDMTGQTDLTVQFGKAETIRSFRLLAGSSSYIESRSGGIPAIPIEYSLSQNYPNPFNPATTIVYSVSHSGRVVLEVFSLLGQRVATLVDGFQPIGHYSVLWDGRDGAHKPVASGIYYYRVRVNEFAAVRKMTLVK